MTTEENNTVSVSLNFNNAYRYEFTVTVPLEVSGNRACFRLTGTNSAGKNFRLGRLGLGTMELLGAIGHARGKENRTGDDGAYWLLRPDPIREAPWARMRKLVQVGDNPASKSTKSPETKLLSNNAPLTVR